jgi:hypothetical protein
MMEIMRRGQANFGIVLQCTLSFALYAIRICNLNIVWNNSLMFVSLHSRSVARAQRLSFCEQVRIPEYVYKLTCPQHLEFECYHFEHIPSPRIAGT